MSGCMAVCIHIHMNLSKRSQRSLSVLVILLAHDTSPENFLTEEEVYLVSESKGLVFYDGKDIAKERALVCGDRSMILLVHICLNKERNVNAFCLVLFFPYLFCLGIQPMR